MHAKNNKTKSMSFPRDALEQAEVVKNGWQQVGERLNVPNLDLVKFGEKLAEAQKQVERAERLKQERAQAIQERNVYLSDLWDLTKRVRNAAKATFGDTSEELDILTNPGINQNHRNSR